MSNTNTAPILSTVNFDREGCMTDASVSVDRPDGSISGFIFGLYVGGAKWCDIRSSYSASALAVQIAEALRSCPSGLTKREQATAARKLSARIINYVESRDAAIAFARECA